MKKLGVSQRVEEIAAYRETRDCLDQRWSEFARAIDGIVLPLPNIAAGEVPGYLDAIAVDGIILSGGNSISTIESEAADVSVVRDTFERAVLDYALAGDLPVVGVCRGMQLINVHLGGELVRIEGHVGSRHTLQCLDNGREFPQAVNSYHNWGIPAAGLSAELKPLALDESGNVEAFVHRHKKLLGIMWHPEREGAFHRLDLDLIGDHFS